MEDYLGETLVEIKDTEFKNYTPSDWALYFMFQYGQIDGAHHKTWVLDQVARILKGTKVIVSLAKWKNNHSEYRVTLGEPSAEYTAWVEEYKGEDEYSYDEGIAP